MVTVVRGDRPTGNRRGGRTALHRQTAPFTTVLALLALLALLLPSTASAEVTSLRAEASPVSLQIGETFVYQVVVSGSGTLPTPRNNIPDSFQILTGPNSNFQMQIVNGKMSSTRTLSYTLRALRRGQHTIPSPVVKDKGKDIRGNAVQIRVVGPDDDPVTGQAPDAVDDRPASRDRDEEELSGRNLPSMFLRAHVDKDEVYLQEPLVVTFTLYFQPSVQTYDVQRLPTTEGFWSEEWDLPDPPPVLERNLGGSLFKAAEIHRLILYPTKTGELKIGPMDVMLQYMQNRRSRDLFDSFFRQTTETKAVSSQELTIDVKPLPEASKPADFANVVGDYRIRASMDSDTVQTNESVTLTVVVEGEGNIGFLPAPELRVPPDIELYEPEMTVNKRAGGGVISGRKTFTWLLIPRRPGEQRIQPVQFSFFDTPSGKYKTLQADPGTLTVLPAAGWAADTDSPGGTPAPVESVGRDIRWIRDTAPTLTAPRTPLHRNAGYWSLYALPLLIAAGGLALRKRRDQLAGQATLQVSRKAARRAQVALKEARAAHQAGNIAAGYDALARGLTSYLGERLAVPPASLDAKTRGDALRTLEISESNRSELETIFSLCNTARFSPHGSEASALNTAIDRAANWIDGVDRKLRPLA